ncbi:MAG: GspH/FimT family pseudopilin [Rhodocyclaceae bacterium]|jgi:type IV fimbrial biogenesis protein FimT|nr:GspH/FimT family pseudopilin [Rhodocyclaceae bacterium]MCE2978454.1 GspH/FimT family pseudopilin [Betaproteobacteria bacterium]MCA3073562.1 GspH/FimT family pseudopilin [Rhodocyclaceae bacterium]MCA3091005.1 GspH/FimT family pseudopilin [Rhodocyclaceae bacterium]MCA3095253.1 GspH/FimT family pseudopilin [Rhodocyclaceae bacterium]
MIPATRYASPAAICRAAHVTGQRPLGVPARRGFTLIELLVVLTIAVVLLAAGLPNFQDFIREQRVRSIASDMLGDFALARSEAVRYSGRVVIARAGFGNCTVAGTAWRDGWCMFADLNANNSVDAGEMLKVQQAVGGQVRICSAVADFANTIIFGPRGQVVRASAIGANDGMTITDDSTGAANSRTRRLMFGLVGRVTAVNQNNAAPDC